MGHITLYNPKKSGKWTGTTKALGVQIVPIRKCFFYSTTCSFHVRAIFVVKSNKNKSRQKPKQAIIWTHNKQWLKTTGSLLLLGTNPFRRRFSVGISVRFVNWYRSEQPLKLSLNKVRLLFKGYYFMVMRLSICSATNYYCFYKRLFSTCLLPMVSLLASKIGSDFYNSKVLR